jgi:hypothetical protein
MCQIRGVAVQFPVSSKLPLMLSQAGSGLQREPMQRSEEQFLILLLLNKVRAPQITRD